MQDENTVTGQDANSVEGMTSDGDKGTSAKATRTYTEKELSDRLSKAGLERVASITRQFNSQIDDLQRQLDEKELAGLKDNPDAVSSFQLKKKIRDMEAQLRQKEADFEAYKEKATRWEEHEARTSKMEKASKFASKYASSDVNDLLDIPEDKWKGFADKYWKSREVEPEPAGRPDSGVTSGGFGILTNEQAERMSVEEYKARRKKDGASYR